MEPSASVRPTTARLVNQLEVIGAYLTQCSDRPNAHQFHILAYTDEMDAQDLGLLLNLAGLPTSKFEPKHRGHFNVVHLQFPTLDAAYGVAKSYSDQVKGPAEIFIFGPYRGDGVRIGLTGMAAKYKIWLREAPPIRPHPGFRRRVGPLEPVASASPRAACRKGR